MGDDQGGAVVGSVVESPGPKSSIGRRPKDLFHIFGYPVKEIDIVFGVLSCLTLATAIVLFSLGKYETLASGFIGFSVAVFPLITFGVYERKGHIDRYNEETRLIHLMAEPRLASFPLVFELGWELYRAWDRDNADSRGRFLQVAERLKVRPEIETLVCNTEQRPGLHPALVPVVREQDIRDLLKTTFGYGAGLLFHTGWLMTMVMPLKTSDNEVSPNAEKAFSDILSQLRSNLIEALEEVLAPEYLTQSATRAIQAWLGNVGGLTTSGRFYIELLAHYLRNFPEAGRYSETQSLIRLRGMLRAADITSGTFQQEASDMLSKIRSESREGPLSRPI